MITKFFFFFFFFFNQNTQSFFTSSHYCSFLSSLPLGCCQETERPLNQQPDKEDRSLGKKEFQTSQVLGGMTFKSPWLSREMGRLVPGPQALLSFPGGPTSVWLRIGFPAVDPFGDGQALCVARQFYSQLCKGVCCDIYEK